MARTVVDLARDDPRSGRMAADAALHEGLVTAPELLAVLDRSGGLPGVVTARAALAGSSALIESPLESLCHLAVVAGGLPAPLLQQWLVGADGRRYRVDFYWPEHRLALEADGRVKYDRDALWAEKRRELALTRAGYRVVRVVWRDIVDTWPQTRAWLRRELMVNPPR